MPQLTKSQTQLIHEITERLVRLVLDGVEEDPSDLKGEYRTEALHYGNWGSKPEPEVQRKTIGIQADTNIALAMDLRGILQDIGSRMFAEPQESFDQLGGPGIRGSMQSSEDALRQCICLASDIHARL